MESQGIKQENIRHYLKIEPKFIHEQRKGPFHDAIKTEGVDFYEKTYKRMIRLLSKTSNKEKLKPPWEKHEIGDDWMEGIVKNKRDREILTNEEMTP